MNQNIMSDHRNWCNTCKKEVKKHYTFCDQCGKRITARCLQLAQPAPARSLHFPNEDLSEHMNAQVSQSPQFPHNVPSGGYLSYVGGSHPIGGYALSSAIGFPASAQAGWDNRGNIPPPSKRRRNSQAAVGVEHSASLSEHLLQEQTTAHEPRQPKKNKDHNRDDVLRNVGVYMLQGRRGFTCVNRPYIAYCLDHHHALEQPDCLFAEDDHKNRAIFQSFSIPIAVSNKYTFMKLTQTPSTYYKGLIELANFTHHLQKYVSHVVVRDTLQKYFLDQLQSSQFPWGPSAFELLKGSVVAGNLRACSFYETVQHLIKHCYLLNCQALFEEMLKEELIFGYANAYETEAASTVIGLYETLKDARKSRKPDENADLPITGTDRSIWGEFARSVVQECKKFASAVSDHCQEHQFVRDFMDRTTLAPMMEIFLTGGFLPRDVSVRTTSLPTFIFMNAKRAMQASDSLTSPGLEVGLTTGTSIDQLEHVNHFDSNADDCDQGTEEHT